MGLTDILKGGYELIKGGGTAGVASSIFEKIMGGPAKNDPEVGQQATEKKEYFKGMREGLFGEIGKSLLLRTMPRLSALTDVGLQLTGNKGDEKVGWQNEFETITALALLVPNSWKHHLTDLFANNAVFKNIVKYYPGLDMQLPIVGEFLSKDLPVLGKGGTIRDRILNENPPDPDAVIQALRVIHQDVFVTGKMSFDKLKGVIGTPAAAATILGGGGALAAADKLLGGDSNSAPSEGGIVNQLKQAVGMDGGGSGKKIIDMAAANPALEKTKMQKNLLKLIDQLGVKDSAILKKGSWDSNDEVTIEFQMNGGKYYLIFDNDVSSTDLKLNNSAGAEIANFTDWGTLDADDDAKKIVKAVQSNPSAPLPSPATPKA